MVIFSIELLLILFLKLFLVYSEYVKTNHLNEINGELKIHCGKLCSENGEMYFDKDNLKCVCFLKRSIDGKFITILFTYYLYIINKFYI